MTDSFGQVWREGRHHCIDTDRQYPLLAGSFVTCAWSSQNEQPSSEKLCCWVLTLNTAAAECSVFYVNFLLLRNQPRKGVVLGGPSVVNNEVREWLKLVMTYRGRHGRLPLLVMSAPCCSSVWCPVEKQTEAKQPDTDHNMKINNVILLIPLSAYCGALPTVKVSNDSLPSAMVSFQRALLVW